MKYFMTMLDDIFADQSNNHSHCFVSGFMQGVISKAEVSEDVWERAKGLTIESSLIVRGKVRTDDRAPGGYELELCDLEPV